MEKVKTELPSDTVATENVSKIGESSLKPQEVVEMTQKDKKKTSQTEGCINKDDAEWY